MGLFMRLKLETLPIVHIDNMGEAVLALASVGVEPQVLKRIKADHKTQLRKYFKDYRSLAEIDAYAIEKKRVGRFAGVYVAWKRVGPYLVLFGSIGVGVRLGFPASPYVSIIRTGPSTWRACDLSAMERDIEDSSDSTLDTAKYPYVGSICGNTFHRSGYPCSERIPAENVHGFESITDAKDSGYKPCAKCRPTETRKTVVIAKSKVKTKRKNSPKREFVCVISANGKNFHRPNCRLVKNIRDENLIGFYSISEPTALGFERCSRCKPGEDERKIIIIK